MEEDPDRIDWTAVWEGFLKTLPSPPVLCFADSRCVISLREEAPEVAPGQA